ncbi:hypothetical protein FE257_012046 [Aspergillus nanangensis]|uniref:Lysosomal dipeptide transporter MFSD1 n=1 Tax=Aspergillus nanangensis TaxID=2582783 RepID=A0AAD4CGJ2_ASPNN|nr:hypothetical protein FE257_012046 [Aspergillus nanangensis]
MTSPKISSIVRVEPPDGPSTPTAETAAPTESRQKTPRLVRFTAVCLICCISVSSHWSAGVSKAMKSTIKDEMEISNTQFSLLEASEDFMETLLLMFSGILTDRLGGAVMMVYGKMLYTIGSILVASAVTVRSFDFMIVGRVIAALGEISTKIAQYKMFSSWFAPSQGFAATLGFESAAGKIGGFVSKATANKCGFIWPFWIIVFVNLLGNTATLLFWFLNRYCEQHYDDPQDAATGENLKKSKFKFQRMFQISWMVWLIVAFALFEESTVAVFSQNSTELAEMRFHTDRITAGWYSAVAQYGGLFLAPILGIFLDVWGNRATVLCICGTSLLLSMLVLTIFSSSSGTIACFVLYGFVKAIGTTTIVDSFRTSLWEESIFGSAYALKETMNSATNVIVRMVTGVLQDADNDSYRRVVRVYLFLSACLMVVGLVIFLAAVLDVNLAPLQWTRKERFAKGPTQLALLRENHLVLNYRRTRWISKLCFLAIMLLTMGSWAVYIWGAVTGNKG